MRRRDFLALTGSVTAVLGTLGTFNPDMGERLGMCRNLPVAHDLGMAVVHFTGTTAGVTEIEKLLNGHATESPAGPHHA